MRSQLSFLIAALFPSCTLADFHIGEIFAFNSAGSITEYVACPSNYFNCNCFKLNPDRGVILAAGVVPSSAQFSLPAGLCGMKQLDFYYKSDKGGWDFYVHGGDGSLQGTCYKNSATKSCAGAVSVSYSDALVCYSYICKS
jgi:hypothetical protein